MNAIPLHFLKFKTLKMRGKCCRRKGATSHPSLRRHYPDQVYGFNLSLACHFGLAEVLTGKHPGNTENFSKLSFRK